MTQVNSSQMFAGKKGIIMGVANEYSIAHGISKFLHSQGAKLGFSRLPDLDGRDRMEKRVSRAVGEMSPEFIFPCDVDKDADVETFFTQAREKMGEIDFIVHSIAFAPVDDIRCRTIDTSRAGFLKAMDTSVYSFLRVCHYADKVLAPGGSVLTLTYFGGEKVVAGYNMMGVCKAALESAVRYAAFDLGAKNMRVNAISAGPIKTLAASAIGDFSKSIRLSSLIAPLGRSITKDEVASTAGFLLSSWASGITGENVHVDCGYHMMGSLGHASTKFDAALSLDDQG